MRIGLFYRDYNQTGGVPLEVKGYARAFSEKGVNVFIYCMSKSKALAQEDEAFKVRVYDNSVKGALKLFKDIKNNIDSLDLIHMFGFLIPENILPYYAAKISKVAIVISPLAMLHKKVMQGKLFYQDSNVESSNFRTGSAYKEVPFSVKLKSVFGKYVFLWLFGRRMVAKSDGVHYSSTFEQENAKYYIRNYTKPELIALPPVKIWVNEYSVTPDDSKYFAVNNKLSKKINIVFWSRIDFHYKGLDIALEGINYAVKQLSIVNFSVFLIGPDYHGGQKNVERLIEEYNLQGVVHILDYKQFYPSKAPLISADAQITLSPCDGVLRTVREGMFFGVPQIITEGTQMADLVMKYDAGFVVKETENKPNYEVLGDYLIQLSSNPEILKKQAENVKVAVTELSDSVVAEKFLEFYKKVCQIKYGRVVL